MRVGGEISQLGLEKWRRKLVSIPTRPEIGPLLKFSNLLRRYLNPGSEPIKPSHPSCFCCFRFRLRAAIGGRVILGTPLDAQVGEPR